MPKPLGLKIKNATTGKFSASGIIGCHWSTVGRTWTNRAALGASIAVWAQRNAQWPNPHQHPGDWVVVMMTEQGLVEFSFLDWQMAKGKKNLPDPINRPPKMTLTIEEIDEVEEAMRNYIGDADAAGELSQRVVEILMTHMENTV